MSEGKTPSPKPRRKQVMDQPVPEIYAGDTDLARDNHLNDLPAAELIDLEYTLPKANGEDF